MHTLALDGRTSNLRICSIGWKAKAEVILLSSTGIAFDRTLISSVLLVLLKKKLYFAFGECVDMFMQCLSKAEQFSNIVTAAAGSV